MLCNRRVYNSTIQNCARNSEIDHGASFNLRSSNWATRVHVHSAAIWRQDSVYLNDIFFIDIQDLYSITKMGLYVKIWMVSSPKYLTFSWLFNDFLTILASFLCRKIILFLNIIICLDTVLHLWRTYLNTQKLIKNYFFFSLICIHCIVLKSQAKQFYMLVQSFNH